MVNLEKINRKDDINKIINLSIIIKKITNELSNSEDKFPITKRAMIV